MVAGAHVPSERLKLDTLSHWVTGMLRNGEQFVRSSFVRCDASLLNLAETLGILTKTATASHLACPVCPDDSHRCRVSAHSGSRYSIRCLKNGKIELSNDDVALLSLNREALLKALARAVGYKVQGIRTYASSRLANLGFWQDGADGRTIGYADLLEDENSLAGVVTALQTQFPKGPGIIATPSLIPITLPLPKGYSFIAFQDLFYGHSGQLKIDGAVVASRLGLGSRGSLTRGRPSKSSTTKYIWQIERNTSSWPKRRGDQAALIASNWPPDGGAAPALGTIKKHISALELRGVPYDGGGARLQGSRQKSK